jgi:drug/metabolite transporter (DMT)-like permease
MFFILLILSMVLWGISWPVSKMISKEASFEMVLFLRFFTTTLAYIPILLIRKESFALNKKSARNIFFASIILLCYNLFFFAGVKYGLAGLGGVLATSLNPIFNFLFVTILTRQLIPSIKIFGILIGLFAGLIILQIWNFNSEELIRGGNIYFLLASVSWAILTMITSSSKGNISILTYSFYIYLIGSAFSFFLVYSQDFHQLSTFSNQFWYGLFFISCISTAFGTTIYFFASTKLGSIGASSFIFLVPLSAMFSSWALVGEEPKPTTIFGGVLAIFAVYLINKKNV